MTGGMPINKNCQRAAGVVQGFKAAALDINVEKQLIWMAIIGHLNKKAWRINSRFFFINQVRRRLDRLKMISW